MEVLIKLFQESSFPHFQLVSNEVGGFVQAWPSFL